MSWACGERTTGKESRCPEDGEEMEVSKTEIVMGGLHEERPRTSGRRRAKGKGVGRESTAR